MKRRCAWCGVVYGHKEPLHVGVTTHGACEACQQKIVENFKRLEGDVPKPTKTASKVELWISPARPSDHS
jgi:hypothetical protein